MSHETTTRPPAATASAGAPPESTADTGLGHPITETADPIDRVVRLAPKWTIFMLAACALLVAGALVWAFQGVISQTVPAPGIYIDRGSTAVTSQVEGTVSGVLVTRGDTVAAGQTLIELTNGDTIVAPVAGEVSSIFVAAPSALWIGETVMLVTDVSIPSVAFALLPAVMVGSEVAGKPVNIEVSTAPSATYGYLQGTVIEVSEVPLTTAQVASVLDIEAELVTTAMGDKPGLLTVIALTPEPDNPSQYSWTVGDGPPFLLSQGTSVTANVILQEQKPIEILFPSSASDDSDQS
jgi:multidrug efflux pump subunit AcrA (membrane-fusion protein)